MRRADEGWRIGDAARSRGRHGAPAIRLLGGSAWWWLPLLLLILLLVFAVPDDATAPYRISDFSATPCNASPDAFPRVVGERFGVPGGCWRLTASLSAPELNQLGAGILLISPHRDVSIFINGIEIRRASRHGNVSLLTSAVMAELGSGTLRPGSNELQLELSGGARRTSLRAAYFGPTPILQRWQKQFSWIQTTGAMFTVVMVFAMLLFLVPITISRPNEIIYRWYALGLLGAALYSVHFATAWRPLSDPEWNTLQHLGLVTALWALIRFTSIELGIPVARLQQLLLALAVTLIVITMWWTPDVPASLMLSMRLGLRLSLLLLLLDLIRRWWHGRDRDRHQVVSGRWFASLLVLTLLLAVSDTLRNLLDEDWPVRVFLLHWGLLFVVTLMFSALLIRIVRDLGRAEHNQAELALALGQRERELETEFSLRRSAEAARTLAEERQRIMRDMHDGVGGQLVAMIAQLQSSTATPTQVAAHLRRLLEDLRLMIDSLDAACADLSVALGMLRARVEPLLAEHPVTFRWQTAALPDLPAAPPETVLHVLRILQEALTNALRHASASTIEVAADWDGQCLQIRVCDDGLGLAATCPRGRGLANMRSRAQAIGGTLRIGPLGTELPSAEVAKSATPGTCVRLDLPLPAKAKPQP